MLILAVAMLLALLAILLLVGGGGSTTPASFVSYKRRAPEVGSTQMAYKLYALAATFCVLVYNTMVRQRHGRSGSGSSAAAVDAPAPSARAIEGN